MRPLLTLTAALAAVTIFTAHAEAQQVTLRVVGWKGSAAEPANLPELNAKFMKENPDVKVDYSFFPENQFQTVINPQFLAGNAPDVVMVDKGKMDLWAQSGYLRDLSGEPWVSTLVPYTRTYAKYGGKTYQFVMEVIGVGMYANLDLLKQAGVARVPTSYTEFRSALTKLKAKGITPIYIANKGGWTGEMLTLLFAANTVNQLDPEWDEKVGNGTASFAKGWTVPLERVRQLASANVFNPKLMNGIDEWSQGLADFKAGKVAFTIQGAWNISDFKKTAPNLNFAFAPFPGGDKAIGVNFVGTGLAINAKTTQANAARRYVTFFAKNENLVRYLTAEAAFSPLVKGTSPMPAEAALFTEAHAAGRTVLYQPSLWPSDKASAAEKIIRDGVQGIFLNPSSASVTTVLQQLDQNFRR